MIKKIVLTAILMACLGGFGLPDVQGTVSPGWEKLVIGSQISPIYQYVEDIDGDGKLDVAATTNVHPSGANSEVAWYRNNGSGTAWQKTIISSGNALDNPIFGAAGIIMTDIDGDGRKDAVVVTGNVLKLKGDVYWFKAPEDPTTGPWQRFTLETGALNSYFKVYTMDANGDGKQDIVVGGNTGAVLFLNPGTPDQPGAAWTKVPLPANTGTSLYLDDINGDGKIDIVNSDTGRVVNRIANVSWIDVTSAPGELTPTFDITMIDSNLPSAFDVNTMDINEDGRKDVIVSIFQESFIYWYEQPANGGDPWIQHVVTNTYSGTDIYTGDIDGNGKADLIISGLMQNKISWFSYQWENGQALWTEHILDNNILLPGDISLNDMDGDGDLDVVVTSLTSNQVVWYKNVLNEITTTTTVPSTTTTTPPTIIQLSYFAATPKAGKVILQWNTEAEIDNAGFSIYRAESETGKYTRINDSIVPAKGLATQGASYEFIDTDVKNRNTYYYKLEDIDLNGTSTMHGPVSATPRLLVGILK
jgi:hypothetical protein